MQGSYKAYVQKLDIEEGVLRFTGRYGNPALDILAIRLNLQQRVGVQIRGTAQLPSVRLYAEPDIPEVEKKAWWVLERSGASGSAEAALLQGAALALLSGKHGSPADGLFNALGLNEVTNGGATEKTADGTSAATVKLCKRFSRNFYGAYERSLTGAAGPFYILYDESRRITLRAETSEQSVLDLIFTSRFD